MPAYRPCGILLLECSRVHAESGTPHPERSRIHTAPPRRSPPESMKHMAPPRQNTLDPSHAASGLYPKEVTLGDDGCHELSQSCSHLGKESAARLPNWLHPRMREPSSPTPPRGCREDTIEVGKGCSARANGAKTAAQTEAANESCAECGLGTLEPRSHLEGDKAAWKPAGRTMASKTRCASHTMALACPWKSTRNSQGRKSGLV
ncbi:hypothetical protein P7K49_032593 [Saguinus oedipus]|uniref:Uncharacterized protein n=1 Tax=Saguinus oedipus TaxID=9490 RepID=A0ABQ9TYN4_SAGOE|nr:hypothetical protein P7K49_032593 [Saguinus oedipus]